MPAGPPRRRDRPPTGRHDAPVDAELTEATARSRAVEVCARRLADAGVLSPRVDAARLVSLACATTPGRLALRPEALLSSQQAERLRGLLARREAREPLQLVEGTAAFRRLEVEVVAGVLVPRPETEVVAGAALARLPEGGTALEPCCGTGAIALALADEGAPGRVVAGDVDPACLRLARRNAERLGLDVEVVASDLLDGMPAELRGKADVVVANPPYLTPAELDAAPEEVRDHEPADALVGGPDGLGPSLRLVEQAAEWLRPGGWLVCESAGERLEALAVAAEARLGHAEVIADLTGRPRVLVARAD